MDCAICHTYPIDQSYVCSKCTRLKMGRHLRMHREHHSNAAHLENDLNELLRRGTQEFSTHSPAHLHLQMLRTKIAATKKHYNSLQAYIHEERSTTQAKTEAFKRARPLLHDSHKRDQRILKHYKADARSFRERRTEQRLHHARHQVAAQLLASSVALCQHANLQLHQGGTATPRRSTNDSSLTLPDQSSRSPRDATPSRNSASAAQPDPSMPSSLHNRSSNSSDALPDTSNVSKSTPSSAKSPLYRRNSSGRASITRRSRSNSELDPNGPLPYHIELFQGLTKFPYLSAHHIVQWLKGELTLSAENCLQSSVYSAVSSPPTNDDIKRLNATLGYIGFIVDSLARNLFVRLPCHVHYEGSSSRIYASHQHPSAAPSKENHYPLYFPLGSSPSSAVPPLEQALHYLNVNIRYLCFVHGIVVVPANKDHFMHNLLSLKHCPHLGHIAHHEFYSPHDISPPSRELVDSVLFHHHNPHLHTQDDSTSNNPPVAFFPQFLEQHTNSAPSDSPHNYYIESNNYITKYIRVAPWNNSQPTSASQFLSESNHPKGKKGMHHSQGTTPFDSDLPNRPSVHKMWPRGYLSGSVLIPDFLDSLLEEQEDSIR